MTELTTTPITESVSKINSGMAAFEERKAELIKLFEQTKNISRPEITDKPAIKKLSETRKRLKNARVQVEKEGKAMRDLITPITKGILAKEKELVAIIEPEEARLQALENDIEADLERIRKEQEEQEAQRVAARTNRLLAMNMEFNGTRYLYGPLSLSAPEVTAIDDELFEEFCSRVKVLFDADQAEKAEQERIRLLTIQRQDTIRPVWHLYNHTDPDSHEDTKESIWEKLGSFPEEYFSVLLGNLQKKQEEIEEQAERNRKEAEEIEEQKKKLRQQRDEVRRERLTAIGANKYPHLVICTAPGVLVYDSILLLEVEDGAFETCFSEIKGVIQKHNEQKERFDTRSMQLIESGFMRGPNGGFRYVYLTTEFGGYEDVSDENLKLHTDEIWKYWFAGFQDRKAKDAELKAQREAEEKKRIADEARQEERARLKKEQDEQEAKAKAAQEKAERKARRAPDEEKIRLYVHYLRSVPVPELKGEEMKQLLQGCREEINQVVKSLEEKINEL